MSTATRNTRAVLQTATHAFSILAVLLLILAPSTLSQDKSVTAPKKPSLVTFPPEELERLDHQLAEKQKSLWSKEPVDPATTGSNGCGPGWLMTLLVVLPEERRDRYKKIANIRTFQGWDSNLNVIKQFDVNFRPACDLHDAGYAGLLVLDKLAEGADRVVDFSSWTKEAIDTKFYNDLRKLCDRQISSNSKARDECKGWSGARLYHELVSTVGYVSFDCNLNDGFLTRFRKVPPQFCTRKYTDDGWFIPAD